MSHAVIEITLNDDVQVFTVTEGYEKGISLNPDILPLIIKTMKIKVVKVVEDKDAKKSR